MPPAALKKVIIHTDGGCEGNPGPGAWAAVLQYGPQRREICGGSPATTNNRMELQAAIEALRALNQRCTVEIYTDSQYLRKGITEWVPMWKKRGWKTASKEPVKNRELWIALDKEAARHQIEWRWLKGHAGHKENERCDELANAEMTRIRKAHTREQLRELLRQFKEVSETGAASPATLPL